VGNIPGSQGTGFLYSHGVLMPISVRLPTSINNRGQIVGAVNGQGVLYSDGILTTNPIAPSQINNLGDIAGCTGGVAAKYSNGTVTSLGTLPGDSSSCATGINDNG
jgi:uncharacterized membrane protein